MRSVILGIALLVSLTGCVSMIGSEGRHLQLAIYDSANQPYEVIVYVDGKEAKRMKTIAAHMWIDGREIQVGPAGNRTSYGDYWSIRRLEK